MLRISASSSQEDPELEQQEIDQLLARGVDCMFIATTQITLESFRRIEKQETPYILLDRKLPGLAANFVGVDDDQVGFMATERLVEIGRRRIAHIGTLRVSAAFSQNAPTCNSASRPSTPRTIRTGPIPTITWVTPHSVASPAPD
ncbi:MAG TPA: substrate-binding domain-containing protein [Blastocatellia bacterium]